MSERTSQGRPLTARSRFSGLVARLASYPRSRWAVAKARRVHIVLTAALLVTGLTAWALAVVQPWTSRFEVSPVLVDAPGLDPEKVRAISAALEKLYSDVMPQPSAPLRRNPFASPAGAEAPPQSAPAARPAERLSGEPQYRSPEPARAESPAAPPASVSPLAALEAAKRLRLEVILITPAGDRWAVINGQNYRQGDAVAGFRIVEIQEGKVRLQQAGTICLLRME